jgi:hypothetical protein
MITKFETYIKESIIDMMSPKSNDDVILNIIKSNELVSNIIDYVDEISDPIKSFLISQGLHNIDDYKIIDFKYDTDSNDVYGLFERITMKSHKKIRKVIDEFTFNYFKDVGIIYLYDMSGEVNFMITTIDNLKDQLAKLSL